MYFAIFDNKESIDWMDIFSINRNKGDYCVDILSKYRIIIKILNNLRVKLNKIDDRKLLLDTIYSELKNNGYSIKTNIFKRLYNEGDYLFLYTFSDFLKNRYDDLSLNYNPLIIDNDNKAPKVDEEKKDKCIINDVLENIDRIIKAFNNFYDLVTNSKFKNLQYFQEFIEPRKKTTFLLKEKDKFFYITKKEDLKEKDFFTKLIQYEIESPIDYLDVYLSLIMNKELIIKRCKNCNKFFAIYDKRSNTVYCDNPSPQNSLKKCFEIAPTLIYREAIKNDDIKRERDKIDQVFRTRKNRAKSKKEKDFYERKRLEFKKAFSKKNSAYEEGNITEQAFIDWIKKQKEGEKNECKRTRKK